LERNNRTGGNAGSFELSEIRVDYGSHRLHPACNQEILQDIHSLLGDDLLDRPRHGRIRLLGQWIHFPLKPVDLALRLPASFSAAIANDLIMKLIRGKSNQQNEESFASILEAGLGRTICRDFYFPYARKIWGMPPEELSAVQARRRVAASSLGKMFLKVLSVVPGIRTGGSGRFFYPRGGFGQISERLEQAAKDEGAILQLDSEIESIQVSEQHTFEISYKQKGKMAAYRPDYLWSTIPITDLVQYIEPAPPASVMRAANETNFRSMILIYLLLEQDRFSEYDAHYFPESDIPITRLSEPKNYSNISEPRGRTVLCAELPCSTTDPEWRLTDDELGDLVLHSLNVAGLRINSSIKTSTTRRLRQAYPIYQRGYQEYFDLIDGWIGLIGNLISFGRQGLFAHDNTHHSLYMAYCAVNCLDNEGRFDHKEWQKCRRVFETHVVED
jgi:protoporphyrinogen oxidase